MTQILTIKSNQPQKTVNLTPAAVNKIRELVTAEDEPGLALRMAVRPGGCSGFSYALGFDKAFDENVDAKSSQHGVMVVVDKKSALYLDGTSVDFYEGLEKRGFTFDNPNVVKSCGCGSSFQA